ncbi:hypothetical protein A2130_02600 [Candidatus Woesebacteria bacterium GWC2_33_12]|uniref:DNA 3'-5' helicase n=1 Tax=Candidatus Woesebacteria bacterium GW2011_GWB1_33_22 TaxID=1618566 RepID=A0A0F9ZJ81_9BACT|nr:MAG: hypothetical protein UR29_C0013G0019 [Candidatus Woesebacteria bacterium GW2011_GWC2_33_12]KKP41705.1 MAG: hypothetical protein UR33_C0011G0020 [Candidatus Woesebacteria bacterium GW2011_GWA2_33_20]KKP44159.1 MAG: hypothetical protein UR35_C0011G0045 [Candidatus Woesebacteria bacterium GW2011_GWB1_33_22]KKP45818.1 MAG: hypothetical protein UR37_C0014G0045 [Microgenomates group bacterium GW2011_GWC1_33_28]KKP50240.1 MAG: hypothetical protein UR41_C0010G0044 [Candidatus Woesebacteria bact
MKGTPKKLNKEQLQAVKHDKGPLLIIAGAGTGKTTVITERIKYLITKERVLPEEILALTFTEKAAAEMEERVDMAMPLGYGEMWISTFHAFCDRVLRDNAIHIGLPSNFKLMTTAESIDLIKKNLFDFKLDYFRPLGNPNKFIEGMLQHFSRLQDEVVRPEEYLKYAKKYTNEETLEITKIKELASAYKTYDYLKIKEGKFDFGDLITKTLELFNKRPNILKIYEQKFKYILVDEFQDTNYGQNELINLLARKYGNISVVGDDNQSIYKFRGAAISNIIQFKKTYPKVKIITLNQNYRSTQTILDGAYKLIKHNDPDTLEYRLGISKKLKAVNSKQLTDIKFIHTKSGQEEAEKICNLVTQLISKDKYNYSDIAILVRANNHTDAFIREFERQGIPHQFLGPSKLFEKEEIIDLICYLKVLYNPEDSASLYRLLSSSIFNISSLELIKIATKAKRSSSSIFEVIMESDDKKVVKLLKIIDRHFKLINKETAGQILYDYISEVGIYQKILENSEDVKAKNIAKFFEKIKSFEESNKDLSVFALVDYIDLLTEVGESPNVTDGDWQENNTINILTVHSSKGLEFPVVFLVNLVSERFPSRERREQIPIPDDLIKETLPTGDFHLQEERRLFYVGMTRAKERLYFTAADFYGDGKRKKKISTFVLEALEKLPNLQLPINNFQSIFNLQIPKHESPVTNHQSLKIDYLSVSQIETFKTCPMHYKLKYIYKLPTPPSASISFGVSIHNTLKDYFETKKDIFEIYKNNFIAEGYINKKHKLEFYKKGESYLLGFLKNAYDPKIKTVSLEQKFTIPVDKTLKIGGVIDRLDDLGNGRLEIIDYKTGANIPTQKEVDKDMQLSFYCLAISNLYKVKPEDIKLSLYYLDTQEKITTKRTRKALDSVKKEIFEIKKEIEESDFKCNNNFFCQGKCEYSMFCHPTTTQ